MDVQLNHNSIIKWEPCCSNDESRVVYIYNNMIFMDIEEFYLFKEKVISGYKIAEFIESQGRVY